MRLLSVRSEWMLALLNCHLSHVLWSNSGHRSCHVCVNVDRAWSDCRISLAFLTNVGLKIKEKLLKGCSGAFDKKDWAE